MSTRQILGAERGNRASGSIDSFEFKLIQKAGGEGAPKPIYGRNKLTFPQSEQEQAKQLDAKYKTYSWDRQFKTQKLDTSFLNSVFLQENAQFQDCVFLINEFNKEMEATQNSKEERKYNPWKIKFYSTLYGLLKEVVLTRDRIIQRNFITEVSEWSNSQLNALSADLKKIKSFDNDPAFIYKTLKGETRDFSKFIKPMEIKKRASKSFDRQSFGQHPNFNDESSIIGNRTFIDESTQDNTILEARQPSPEQNDTSNSQTHFKITSILQQSGLPPRTMQPSEIVAEALKDYKTLARTQNPEYEPPQIRLKEYKRRVLSFDDPSKIGKISKDAKVLTEEESFFSRVTYPKPFTFQEMKKKEEEQNAVLQALSAPPVAVVAAPSTVIQQEEGAAQEKPDEANGAASNNVVATEGDNQGEEKSDKDDLDLSGIIVEPPEPGQAVKPPLQPIIRNFQHDEYGKETFIRDLNQKFDIRSNHLVYEPSEEVVETRMEQRWLEGRHKELREKRENQEMISMMQEWAVSKGRIEKEINRKIDSNIYGSRYRECEYRYQKKTAEEMKVLDKTTKEAGLKQNALQEIEEEENKKKRIEQKLKERAERRQERKEKQAKKKKGKGGYDSDSDKEGKGNVSDGDSYDEELDGQFDPTNSKFKNRKRFISLYSSSQRPETSNIDLSTTLPRICKTQLTNQLHPFKGLENQQQRQKIEMIKRLHGNFINVQPTESAQTKPPGSNDSSSMIPPEADKEIAQPSLSVYSRQVAQKLRPFSAIFDSCNIEQIQSEQLAEVREVKNRMAKYKLSVPYKKLRDAMIVPEGLTDHMDLELLPDPGQGLVRNPFMKDKKKKKKKKKK